MKKSNKLKYYITFYYVFLSFSPYFALARDFKSKISGLNTELSSWIPIVGVTAIIVSGLVLKFSRERGVEMLKWSIAGIAIAFSAGPLVDLARRIFS